jgi:pimeloyl-CoA dehydrogenase small subunit
MDFDLSDEQLLLKDSVDRLTADTYGNFEKRRAYQSEPGGWSAANWRRFADMGLTALPFSEADGGFGGGPVETMIVMEALGRSLAVEPYLATVILGGNLLRLGGSAAQRARLIPAIADGSLTLAFAHAERQARYDLHDIATTATRHAGGFLLQGQKTGVLQGDSAGLLLVSARSDGSRRDREGILLVLVDPAAPGVTVRTYRTQDGLRAADILLDGVQVDEAALLAGGLPLIEQVVDIAIAAICAEAVGAMDSAHALTVDYLKTRTQFGVPIGSFQALQHKAADMMMALEQARSMAMFAAMMVGAEPAERRTALSAAKVQINRSARLVGQTAVQLHGGIGMTMEYKVGHLFKRLAIIETLFGDTDFHLRAVTEAGGLIS